jgi:selenocysteine lyase/cysteine desulfurase
MKTLADQRHFFDIPRDVAYLNCAYMSPLLNRAVELGTAGLASKARPWEISPASFFGDSEEARRLFAVMIGAEADDVALVPAAGYGLAVAAANLPVAGGREIVMQAEEFPASVLTWRAVARKTGARIVTVDRPESGDWTAALCEAIGDDTAVVCISQTHWVCGGLTDLVAVSARCRQVGAALVIDGTQSCGAHRFDVTAIDPDYLVAAGYKWMLGPYSTGFLYVAPRHQGGVPLEQGWVVRERAEDFRNLIDYSEEFQPGARRFDVGERSNMALMPAVIAALRQLLDWQIERIEATLGEKTSAIADALRDMGAIVVPDAHRSPHYLSLRFKQGLPDDLAVRLAADRVYVSMRGDRLRITPHLYNDAEDIDRLIASVRGALG